MPPGNKDKNQYIGIIQLNIIKNIPAHTVQFNMLNILVYDKVHISHIKSSMKESQIDYATVSMFICFSASYSKH